MNPTTNEAVDRTGQSDWQASRGDSGPSPTPLPAGHPRRPELSLALRRRIVTIARTPLQPPTSPLWRGLERGMLTTSATEQRRVEKLCQHLAPDDADRLRALMGLLTLVDEGSTGAAAVLAVHGDDDAVGRLSAYVLDATEPRPRRLAAVRGALVIWQAVHETGGTAPVPLMAALRRATRDADDEVRFLAAFVLAMMGRREVRLMLQDGVVRLQSATLRSYCALGLREIGTVESLATLRQALANATGPLAEIIHDAVQTLEWTLRPAAPRTLLGRAAVIDDDGDDDDLHDRATIRVDLSELYEEGF